MDRLCFGNEVYIMELFTLGILIGFAAGYPLGLFIDKLDKKEKAKSGRR